MVDQIAGQGITQAQTAQQAGQTSSAGKVDKKQSIQIFTSNMAKFDTNNNGVMDANEEAEVTRFMYQEQNNDILTNTTRKLTSVGEKQMGYDDFNTLCKNLGINPNDKDAMRIIYAAGAKSDISVQDENYAEKRSDELKDYMSATLTRVSDKSFASISRGPTVGNSGILMGVLYSKGVNPNTGVKYTDIMADLHKLDGEQIEKKYGCRYSEAVEKFVVEPLTDAYQNRMQAEISKFGEPALNPTSGDTTRYATLDTGRLSENNVYETKEKNHYDFLYNKGNGIYEFE